MTWLVTWQDREYDVDPGEFSGLEVALIKQRTTLGILDLLGAVARLDGDAVRVLFWIVDRRTNPELKFSEYEGPSMRTITPHLGEFNEAIKTLMPGKAKTSPSTSETGGSPSSPSDSDGLDESTTS